MKAEMTANIRMVQKYDTDTTKGINVFCEEENEGINDNLIGPVQLVIGGPLEMFSLFKAYEQSGFLPGEFDITVDVGRGSGGKAKLTLLAVKDPSLKRHLENKDKKPEGKTEVKPV